MAIMMVQAENLARVPVYLKLMTGFPTFQPEDVGVELLH
jgi:hypothetical protein